MKYIRTKDGRVLDEKEWKELLDYAESICQNIDDMILKQSDTVEELCDEFITKYKIGKEKPHITISVYNYDDINIVREHIKKMYDEQTKIYGAIWTKWGLKYVAKMNEKGELELL